MSGPKHELPRPDHVLHRNALGDADSQPDPAAADSMIASAANGGGTKMPETSAPVAATASATVSKIGTPS